ncbi:MAG: hypothetical protein ACP6IS_03155 [Candidatus Asgardarchaeia archaeon]
MSERLKTVVNEWISFERDVFWKHTEYFSFSSFLTLTKDEAKVWAYKVRDELLSKRLDFCNALRNAIFEIPKKDYRKNPTLFRGLQNLIDEIERLVSEEIDNFTIILDNLESSISVDNPDIKSALEAIGEHEKKIRDYLTQLVQHVG